MKATRDQLKALVKELLIEVLSEGLGSTGQSAVQRPSIRGNTSDRMTSLRKRPDFDPRLDVPIGGRSPSDALKEAVKRESAGNPIMADILADTAMTTLPSQLSHGDNMGAPSMGGPSISRNSAPVQQEQFAGDPSEIFGEAAQVRDDGSSHWADLAFMSPGKKS